MTMSDDKSNQDNGATDFDDPNVETDWMNNESAPNLISSQYGKPSMTPDRTVTVAREESPQPAKREENSGSRDSTKAQQSYHSTQLVDQEYAKEEPDDSKDNGLAYFTYTPSIAWSFRSHMRNAEDSLDLDLGTGTLDDEIIIGIGMDDIAQGCARVKIIDVLGCMRLCDGD